jgi:Phosphomannomutase
MELFGTAGIRGDVAERVTPELALTVGRAVATEARDRAREAGDIDCEVVVARDGRVSGSALAAAAEAGLASGGAAVSRAGQLPTPALAHASQGRYGLMLTASHNPPSDNGIKLFRDGVEFDRGLERAVEERVGAETSAAWDAWTTSERVDTLATYLADVVEYARGVDVGAEDATPGLDGSPGRRRLRQRHGRAGDPDGPA